jgi:hypothetical protein
MALSPEYDKPPPYSQQAPGKVEVVEAYETVGTNVQLYKWGGY